MLNPRDAARLLTPAEGVHGLAPLASVFGCQGEPLPLDLPSRRAIGAPGRSNVSVVSGPDERRLLLAALPAGSDLRQAVAALADGVSRTSPHLHWAVAATARDNSNLILAACAPSQTRGRVAALSVNRGRITDSDIQAVRLLFDASATSGILAHSRWMEILGREGIGRRFFLALAESVNRMATEASTAPHTTFAERKEAALLGVSRVLFLAFLEAKGWLDGDHDFLQRHFARVSETGSPLHRGLLRPLLFGTLNTKYARRAAAARAFGRVPFLNGGLFTPTPLERRTRVEFSDESLAALFGNLLARWRFTAHEDTATWTDAAVDPEMLGRAFESLMAEGERRRGGAFYTPHRLVRRVTREALAESLASADGDGSRTSACLLRLLDGEVLHDETASQVLRKRARSIRVLDPACGSGAFLVHVLETLASLHGSLGDTRSVSARRRDVLVRQLVGVDMNPVAVWLCQLRLWLSVAVEDNAADPSRVLPLPNLDRHILVGDALNSDASPHGSRPLAVTAHTNIHRVRERYARATGTRKRTLAGALTRAERARAIALHSEALETVAYRRRDLLTTLRSRDLFGERAESSRQARATLARLKQLTRELKQRRQRLLDGGALPFSFDIHCAADSGSAAFDIVLGNPPWVRVHEMPPTVRERLRSRYSVLRGSGWQHGAKAAGVSGGFGAQPEMSAAFVERALELAGADGTVALLVPAKLWRTLSGAALRMHIAREARVVAVEDWSDAPPLFDAVVYPSLLVASRRRDSADELSAQPSVRVTVHETPRMCDGENGAHGNGSASNPGSEQTWSVAPNELPFDRDDPGSPWLLLPPDVRAAFDALRAHGTPLAQSEYVSRPMLGVKTGCNAAFLVKREAGDSPFAKLIEVTAGDRLGGVEPTLLRPAARGEDVRQWTLAGQRPHLVWTHDSAGAPLHALPQGAASWLRPHRARLAARTDARAATRWWSLFRLPAAAFDRPRVVWADIDRRPNAAFIPANDRTVPLNSCYVSIAATDADALALIALLNGPLAAAWLAALAEPARGGYRRFMGWTLSLLPLPFGWREARTHLASISAAALGGVVPSDAELLQAACAAYGVSEESMRPLLRWWARVDSA
ncbi:MAG TPA: DNA methyltransferase [Gemmatimonadales bacterium]|nr:DNA methyltransferase [Gemmatimonadales bacterium]